MNFGKRVFNRVFNLNHWTFNSDSGFIVRIIKRFFFPFSNLFFPINLSYNFSEIGGLQKRVPAVRIQAYQPSLSTVFVEKHVLSVAAADRAFLCFLRELFVFLKKVEKQRCLKSGQTVDFIKFLVKIAMIIYFRVKNGLFHDFFRNGWRKEWGDEYQNCVVYSLCGSRWIWDSLV